jgi:sulfur-oxidizing protein SoxX
MCSYHLKHLLRQLAGIALLAIGVFTISNAYADEPYYAWHVENFSINTPLGGLKGDAQRGRQIVIDGHKGSCLTCHVMPIEEEEFHGDIGPSLIGVASRLTESELRLRIVDEKQINPETIMPGYYRHPKHFTLVSYEYEGKTFLSAQEIEDVVAYLLTLK